MRYKTITIRVCDCNGEIIFVSGKLRAKMLQKPNFESKEIRILGENGINSKLKHRKAHNSILSRRFGDSYGRRVLSYPGDLACRIITLDNLLFLTVRCKRITFIEIEITCSNVIKDAVEDNCDCDDY